METLRNRADQTDELLGKLVARVKQLEAGGCVGGVGIHTEVKARIKDQVNTLKKDFKNAEAQIAKLKAENAKLSKENAKLKKSAKAGGVSSEFKKTTDANWNNALKKAEALRSIVQDLEGENGALKEEIASMKNSSTTIKTDILTNEQLEWLKNRMNKVRSDMIEFMNKKTEIAAEVQAPASSGVNSGTKMTMETIQDLKYYIVTKDLVELKKEREECELGELDDEDLEPYLGRKVRVIEIEEDDDTVNVRFDNHDSQWFPVGCLYTEAAAAPAPAATSSGSQLVQMTLETIQERKTYTVTGDLAYLKKEWYAAELGELDDDDFKGYLNREVKTIDIEEDDETVNVRFDNHDSQWFPITVLFSKVAGAAAPAAAKPVAKAVATPALERMTMETFQERKKYTITSDLAELKKYWYEAELGELDDDDFNLYLGREIFAFDTEEDDETANCRFDNHDSQWFPIQVLFRKAAAAASGSPNGNKKKQSMDTLKERKTYFITKDLVELKKEWKEAELGDLDDEDFVSYLGREVKTIDIEEDDETVNVRFDNHDSQWFPVTSLYQ